MANWADDLWSGLLGSSSEVKVSVPGKVLIVGGYLVLDPRFNGLVVTVNARFSARVTLLTKDSAGCDYGKSRVILISPQISVHPIRTTLELDTSAVSVPPFTPKSNVFVENAVHFSLAVLRLCVPNLSDRLQAGLAIYTQADSVFYSELDSDGVAKAKSGLGSSAALVASVTAALFALFNISNMKLCSRTAQLAHCAAQGKIGSGFDISAAFFGSQVYRRFDAKVLSDVFDSPVHLPETIFAVLDNDSLWSDRHDAIIMPEGIQMILGDVQTGSKTPGMVKRVLAWLQTQGPDRLKELNRLNQKFISILESLRACCTIPELEEIIGIPVDCWQGTNQLGDLLFTLRQIFIAIRENLQQIGAEADVEIEPASQTALLSRTMTVTGVICAGVPGAGGYDAIFALYIGGEQTRRRITGFWAKENVRALDVQEDPLGLISLP